MANEITWIAHEFIECLESLGSLQDHKQRQKCALDISYIVSWFEKKN